MMHTTPKIKVVKAQGLTSKMNTAIVILLSLQINDRPLSAS